MLRLKYGLTQAQLAAALNTKRTYISTVERGVVIPPVLTIERIGAVFGLDIAGLFLTVRQMKNEAAHNQVAA
jgi:transcriptional regulator with XRE-family HTH domain